MAWRADQRDVRIICQVKRAKKRTRRIRSLKDGTVCGEGDQKRSRRGEPVRDRGWATPSELWTRREPSAWFYFSVHEGTRAMSTQVLQRSREASPRASSRAAGAPRSRTACTMGEEKHTYDGLIAVACIDQLPRVHSLLSRQMCGFFGVVATRARDRTRQPRFHQAQSDETLPRLASTRTVMSTTNASASAVVSVKRRCNRATNPRRRSRVSPERIARFPKWNVLSLPGSAVH